MRYIGWFIALFLPHLLVAETPRNSLEIRLISEVRSVQAGRLFFLGLQLKHPPGFHSYWKHPGIVGLATTVDWELPPGFGAGEIQWPAPQTVMMAGHKAQGYEDEILLMIPITAPQKLTATRVDLTARVSWMSCGKVCSPAVKIPFSISLPVSNKLEFDSQTQPFFQKARALVPRPDGSWQARVQRRQNQIILTLAPPTPIQDLHEIHFFTADGQVDSDQQQAVDLQSDGRIRMTLYPAEAAGEAAATLPGVVVIRRREGPPCFLEISPAY